MRAFSLEIRLLVGLLLAFVMAGCPRGLVSPTAQAPVPSAVPPLSGEARFVARSVQASMSEVALAATVSLIEASTNATVASSVTDAEGRFLLSFGGYKPSSTEAYFLEAVKGLSSGGEANRAGASVARVRTLVYWNSGGWRSLTNSIAGAGLIVSRSTTALALVASLRAAAGQAADTGAMVGSLEVGIRDSSLTPATDDTFTPGTSGIGKDEYHRVYGLVGEALVADEDPMAMIAMDAGPPRQYLRSEQGFTVSGLSAIAGASYDTLTITGYGFDPTLSKNVVTFNGFRAEVTAVSADRKSLTVRVPRRAGLSGAIAVQVGGVVKLGPVWTQNAWLDPLDDAQDVKSLLNAAVAGGAIAMQGTGGHLDSANAHFTAGSVNGLARVVNPDPVDGGDGAVDIGIKPLKVLQVYPDGHTQTAAAQGVYNYRPDLFDFEILPVTVFNTLTTLDSGFTATQITKSGTTAPATAAVGGTVARTMRDYDILYFGVADSYAGYDLNTSSRDLTRAFAGLGRGVVFTHDTVRGPAGATPYFNSLTDIHGLGQAGMGLAGSTVYQAPGVNTSSPVLKQPFDLSGVSSFAILGSHAQYQSTDLGATAWYAYDAASASTTPYWTTYTTSTSNGAFFSYGHTEAVPAEFEAKAMINSMYYTFDRGTTISGTFTSRALDSGASGYNWGGSALNWTARIPSANTTLTFQVGANNDPAAITSFVGPDGTSSTSFTATGGSLPAITGRYLRYRATLTTTSILSVPLVSRVDVGATAGEAVSVAVTPNALSAWGSVSFTKTTPGTSVVRVQVLDKNGTPLPEAALSGNSSGFASSPINLGALSTATYPALRLKARLQADEANNKPQILDWRLNWTP